MQVAFFARHFCTASAQHRFKLSYSLLISGYFCRLKESREKIWFIITVTHNPYPLSVSRLGERGLTNVADSDKSTVHKWPFYWKIVTRAKLTFSAKVTARANWRLVQKWLFVQNWPFLQNWLREKQTRPRFSFIERQVLAY